MNERMERVRGILGPPDAMEQEFHAEHNRQVELAGTDTKAIARMEDKKGHIYGVVLRADQLMTRRGNKRERTDVPVSRPTVFASVWWHDYMRMFEMRMHHTFSSGYLHAHEAAEALLRTVRSGVLYGYDPQWRKRGYNLSATWWSVEHHSDAVLPAAPVSGWHALDFYEPATTLREADTLDLAGTPGYITRAMDKDKAHEPVISAEVWSSYQKGEPIKNKDVKTRMDGVLRTERWRRNTLSTAYNGIWQEEHISAQHLAILPHWGLPEEQFDAVVNVATEWARRDGYPFTKQTVCDYVTLYDRTRQIGVYNLDV